MRRRCRARQERLRARPQHASPTYRLTGGFMSSLLDRLTYAQIAKTIDHSLLRPELDDPFITDGCKLAVRYHVASATVRPNDWAPARPILAGATVKLATVLGFPP